MIQKNSNRNIKTVVIATFHMFTRIEENVSVVRRNTEDSGKSKLNL